TDRTPTAIYSEIYERYGIDTSDRYPAAATIAAEAGEAGWIAVETHADPDVEIVLPDEEAFRTWREIGGRGPATAGFTAEQHDELTDAMLAATPRDADGTLRIPFGAIYLTARRPPT
ncbi:MAG: hypothetical protein M3Y40_10345, partial [Chloroflexota bacterium]|nr:hypothetical protein [Chloroflexota bacterium]